MAEEIKERISFTFAKGSISFAIPETRFYVDQTTARMFHNAQSVGLTDEALNMGDLAAPGRIVIINRDASVSASLRGAQSEADCLTLKPGELNTFRLDPTAPRAISDGGTAVVLEYWVFED